MHRCIELARQAIESGDTPVGSLIVDGDELVSEGVEAVRARHDATAHAEMEALRTAFARRRSRDLTGCAPNRPPPLVIRDVLVQECQSVRDQDRG